MDVGMGDGVVVGGGSGGGDVRWVSVIDGGGGWV